MSNKIMVVFNSEYVFRERVQKVNSKTIIDVGQFSIYCRIYMRLFLHIWFTGQQTFFVPQHSSVTHETAELLYVKLMSKNNLPLNIPCRRDSYSEKIKNALVWLMWDRSEGLDLKVSLTLWSVWREWCFAWRLNFDV